jgi:hypothetical protein
MSDKKMLKHMSEEEKKGRKKVLQRQYMAKRRANDPEFLEKQRLLCKERIKERRENDDEYREKHRLYCAEYNKKTKQKLQEMKAKLELIEKSSAEMVEFMDSIKISN